MCGLGIVSMDKILCFTNSFIIIICSRHTKHSDSQTDCQVTETDPSHHRSPGGKRCRKRKCATMFLERKRMGHHPSDQHQNCFTGNAGETCEGQG